MALVCASALSCALAHGVLHPGYALFVRTNSAQALPHATRNSCHVTVSSDDSEFVCAAPPPDVARSRTAATARRSTRSIGLAVLDIFEGDSDLRRSDNNGEMKMISKQKRLKKLTVTKPLRQECYDSIAMCTHRAGSHTSECSHRQRAAASAGVGDAGAGAATGSCGFGAGGCDISPGVLLLAASTHSERRVDAVSRNLSGGRVEGSAQHLV